MADNFDPKSAIYGGYFERDIGVDIEVMRNAVNLERTYTVFAVAAKGNFRIYARDASGVERRSGTLQQGSVVYFTFPQPVASVHAIAEQGNNPDARGKVGIAIYIYDYSK